MNDSEGGSEAAAAVEAHVREFFAGHEITVEDGAPGGSRPAAGHGQGPGPRILTVGPGPRADSWAYVTAGCWASTADGDGQGIEFVLTAPVRDERFAELLRATAAYHDAHHLDVEHSLPIGEPWLPGSACDHLLISLPYLHGPELEHCPVPGGHARVLWALPVTAAEMDYRREHGNEALERLFDEHAILPNDPKRPSVV
ncbi:MULTISPECIES: suppressor of fused domain protein [Streptomyces]|uniref:suppressor of fused domain protein n=1 Tax=Streptomyces TaxID=1883 RepID=UPI00278BB81E|nr:suppressor of fused domain protein [Streptomyces hydrogenans]